jgi:uncharacterized protein YrzB (UPF0473 family)
MEQIKITADTGEEINFYVIEQTRVNGINYILVTESEEDEAEAYILKDSSAEEDADAVYEFVEDDEELNRLAQIFSELIDDAEIV